MNPYLVIVIVAVAGTYLLELMADVLNVRHLSTALPAEFAGFYDAGKYATAQQYLQDNTRFDCVVDTVVTVLTLAFICAGGFNAVDGLVRRAGLGAIATGLLFAGLLVLLVEVLQIPCAVYRTFVIEARYGFNRTTPRTFVCDLLKGWALGALLGGLLLAAVLWLFEAQGRGAWVYAWGVVSVVQVLLLFVGPVLILPLFNKFVPLAPGALREAIEGYARSQRFALQGVFTMDGSRRSTKSNAFFTGFGRFRRIVLFDTLIARHTVEELVAVLAHEMGHYRRRHVAKLLALSVVSNGVLLFVLSRFINHRGLFDAFRMEHLSVYASLVFAGFLYTPLAVVTGMVANALSRRYEYAADAYVLHTGGRAEAFIAALKKLTADNLGNLTPHPLKVFLGYSHPPILERIHAIRRAAEHGARPPETASR